MTRLRGYAVLVCGAAGSALLIFVLLGGRFTPATIGLALIGSACWLVAVASWRTMVPLLRGDRAPGAPRPAAAGRHREFLEREKQRLLRSIKELEFDRAMGKVSSGDFDDLARNLRARALRVMRQLDVSDHAYRDLIEAELRDRLGRRGAAPGAPQPPATGAVQAIAVDRVAAGPRTCAGCTTVNDPDARFCKHCGARL